MSEQDQGQQRLVFEARHWLSRGYTSKEKVAELEAMLRKKRGAKAVELLIEEMRRQWPKRSEWLGKQHG